MRSDRQFRSTVDEASSLSAGEKRESSKGRSAWTASRSISCRRKPTLTQIIGNDLADVAEQFIARHGGRP